MESDYQIRKIYLLLIRTSTMFSKLIHTMTKSNYTHVSIALDIECKELYSFGRKYPYLMLPAGFIMEDIQKGLFVRNLSAPCALYELEVTDKVYRKLKLELQQMLWNANQFRYSCVGPLFCYFGVTYERKNRFFCSQFVADILGRVGALPLQKPPSLYVPNDFTLMPELEMVYEGTLSGLINRQNLKKCN